MMRPSFRLTVQCPECHAQLDAESPDGVTRGPQPQDFTICCYCAVVLVFTAAMTLRSVTKADVEHLTASDCLQIEAMRQQVLYDLATHQAKTAQWN